MKAISLALAMGALSTVAHLQGAVPHIVNYQGRVTANGAPFTGLGQFKFALVSPGRNVNSQALASASVVKGFVVAVNVTAAGAGYLTPPTVTIIDPTGAGASARTELVNGSVASITMLNAGIGYTGPTVTIDPPPGDTVYTAYWSHDGTSFGGVEPISAVAVPVAQGLFTVALGATNIPNMGPLSPAVFAHDDVRVRIWFNDGNQGFHQLQPDQRISAVGYALMAETVPDGSITGAKIAPGAVGNAHLADGAISGAKLASNASQPRAGA
jgi:hypothetical protein